MTTSSLHVFRGGPALSNFRLNALLKQVAAEVPEAGIVTMEASSIFVVETAPSFLAELWPRVYSLLDTDRQIAPVVTDGLFVTPRKATLSPWSSKATDIFHNCGLESVQRVERGIFFRFTTADALTVPCSAIQPALHLIHDRMTEGVYADLSDLFRHVPPAPLITIDVIAGGLEALRLANGSLGLALSDEEISYLYDVYRDLNRNPTDVELVMFGQVNSEHCRHKIFRSDWIIDGSPRDTSLFDMIRNTHQLHPQHMVVAYSDNASVMEGAQIERFVARVTPKDASAPRYDRQQVLQHVRKYPPLARPVPAFVVAPPLMALDPGIHQQIAGTAVEPSH
jgi:phosphoribosylformylglycinamidine synthase